MNILHVKSITLTHIVCVLCQDINYSDGKANLKQQKSPETTSDTELHKSVYEKASQKLETDEILRARTCYLKFALVLHEKCTPLGQSKVHNLYIKKLEIKCLISFLAI